MSNVVTQHREMTQCQSEVAEHLVAAGSKGFTVAQMTEPLFWGETAIREACKALEEAGIVERASKKVPFKFRLVNRAATPAERRNALKGVADEDDPIRLAYEDGLMAAEEMRRAREEEAARLAGTEAALPASLPSLAYGSTLIRALETVWAAIQDRHADVPDVILITGSGASRRGLKMGHHAADRWNHREDGEPLTEVFLSGERIADGPRGILSTLLHEAAHGVNRTRRIKDTSNHRYHNQKFVATAQELGLETATEAHPSIGWSFTSCPDETFAVYAEAMKPLEDWFLQIGEGTGYGAVSGLPVKVTPGAEGPKTSGRLDKIVCRCETPRILRMSKKAFAAGPIRCGVCDHDFAIQED